MSRSEERDNTEPLTEPVSPGGLSSSRTIGAAIIQEGHGNERSANWSWDAAPPLGVKLTVYRLLNMTTMFTFCITKGILTYEGLSTTPTTLDWVSGGVLGVALYWIGLYEQQDSKKWEWFFQVDLAHATGCCTKRVAGGVLEVMFYYDGLTVGCVLFSLLLNLTMYLHIHHLSHLALRFQILLWISYMPVIGPCSAYLCFCELTRRVEGRVWEWQQSMHFLDDHKPDALLRRRYERFRVVGKIVGIFCWITFVGLPFVAVRHMFDLFYLILSDT